MKRYVITFHHAEGFGTRIVYEDTLSEYDGYLGEQIVQYLKQWYKKVRLSGINKI